MLWALTDTLRAATLEPYRTRQDDGFIRLNNNENAYGPSAKVAEVIKSSIGSANLIGRPFPPMDTHIHPNFSGSSGGNARILADLGHAAVSETLHAALSRRKVRASPRPVADEWAERESEAFHASARVISQRMVAIAIKDRGSPPEPHSNSCFRLLWSPLQLRRSSTSDRPGPYCQFHW